MIRVILEIFERTDLLNAILIAIAILLAMAIGLVVKYTNQEKREHELSNK